MWRESILYEDPALFINPPHLSRSIGWPVQTSLLKEIVRKWMGSDRSLAGFVSTALTDCFQKSIPSVEHMVLRFTAASFYQTFETAPFLF